MTAVPDPPVHLGEVLLDTEGQPIQSHGGCVVRVGEAFYWYGEDKAGPTTLNAKNTAHVDFREISCYRSADLWRWDRLPNVLPPASEPGHDLHPSGVVERPKVLHDPARDRWVMWLKIGAPGRGR